MCTDTTMGCTGMYNTCRACRFGLVVGYMSVVAYLKSRVAQVRFENALLKYEMH